MRMHNRNVRVSDEVWAAASARAEAEGTTLSRVLRDWLFDYAAGADAPEKLANQMELLIADWRAGLIPTIVERS